MSFDPNNVIDVPELTDTQTAFLIGYRDQASGKTLHDNPLVGTDQWPQWAAGWRASQAHNATPMQTSTPDAIACQRMAQAVIPALEFYAGPEDDIRPIIPKVAVGIVQALLDHIKN